MARFDMNERAIGELLRSPAVLADLRRRAERVAARAGPGHEVDAGIGSTRARVTVRTVSTAAKRAEAADRNLTRSIDAARG